MGEFCLTKLSQVLKTQIKKVKAKHRRDITDGKHYKCVRCGLDYLTCTKIRDEDNQVIEGLWHVKCRRKGCINEKIQVGPNREVIDVVCKLADNFNRARKNEQQIVITDE